MADSIYKDTASNKFFFASAIFFPSDATSTSIHSELNAEPSL
ncbi:MAG: hypothetical protein M5T52_11305 [Ignavibacteriaceae bacterium]|nr:hypothetical protein [Ignavibacteriaceae bacterium]